MSPSRSGGFLGNSMCYSHWVMVMVKEDLHFRFCSPHISTVRPTIGYSPPANEVCEGYVSVHRGGRAWHGGLCGGGVHGRGSSVAGGMSGGGHVWRGVCMVGGVHGKGEGHARRGSTHHPSGRYYGYGIRSMSGRYTSYWNAFLLYLLIPISQGKPLLNIWCIPTLIPLIIITNGPVQCE